MRAGGRQGREAVGRRGERDKSSSLWPAPGPGAPNCPWSRSRTQGEDAGAGHPQRAMAERGAPWGWRRGAADQSVPPGQG